MEDARSHANVASFNCSFPETTAHHVDKLHAYQRLQGNTLRSQQAKGKAVSAEGRQILGGIDQA
jgi:hypothetical protein